MKEVKPKNLKTQLRASGGSPEEKLMLRKGETIGGRGIGEKLNHFSLAFQ